MLGSLYIRELMVHHVPRFKKLFEVSHCDLTRQLLRKCSIKHLETCEIYRNLFFFWQWLKVGVPAARTWPHHTAKRLAASCQAWHRSWADQHDVGWCSSKVPWPTSTTSLSSTVEPTPPSLHRLTWDTNGYDMFTCMFYTCCYIACYVPAVFTLCVCVSLCVFLCVCIDAMHACWDGMGCDGWWMMDDAW